MSSSHPMTVNVGPGDSVTWTNAGGVHDVTFDDGSFTQPPAPSGDGWTVTRTFATPGAYQYYCSVHGFTGGVGMSGSVVVSASSTTDPGAGTSPSGTTPTGTVGAQGQATPCKSQRNFRIRIRQPRGFKIASAQVTVNGKHGPGLEARHRREAASHGAGRSARSGQGDVRGPHRRHDDERQEASGHPHVPDLRCEADVERAAAALS